MNGYETPSFAAVFGPAHNHEAPKHQAKSGAKVVYGTDDVFFLRSSSKQKRRSQKQRKNVTKSSINSVTNQSQYHVEHLTTFVLDRKDGMITVDDGVRRLRLLDAKGKVWTQEMLLQVDERSVSLMDLETKNELENFSLGSVQHVQAVTNACGYDSILALVCKEAGQNKADLHLFQCDHIKATLIQADIDSAMMDAKGGKVKRRPETLRMILKSDGVIPPPPAAPAPEPPDSGPAHDQQPDVKSRAAAWTAWTNEQQDYAKRPEDEAPLEMTAAHVDRDVQILNHLLDDIEFFITKLQKAAEAAGELSRRRKAKKGKKKGPGEGVLTLRSKPPGPDEFLVCLQNFKHAFNQLGKLKLHIQNPSASDLLHFLFTPLRMVIQASGGLPLARSVLVPLLTRDAVDFLHGSGTAEERHLWVALGDGWTKSRLEWPRDHYFPPCPLTFRDGWEPPPLPAPTRDPEVSQLAEVLANGQVQRQEELQQWTASEQTALQRFPADGFALSDPALEGLQILDQDAAVANFRQAISRHRDRGFDVDGRIQTGLFAKSKYDFVARNNTELSVLKDEVVEVLDDRKQWWKVRNGGGSLGYVPNNILELTGRGDPVYSHTIQLMMPKKEFELFKQLLGELNEKQTTRPDPLPGKLTAVPIPAPAPPPPAPARLPTPPLPPPASEPPKAAGGGGSRPLSRQSSAAAGEAAAAMSDQDQQTQENQRPSAVGRRKSNMEEVQDELLTRLTLGRSAQKKLHVPYRAGTSSVSITYESSADDVRGWLEAKGFSPVTITSLGVLTGAQLFSLNKEELKTVCPDDGARVYSQVTVQKAALERSSGSELQEIMRRRKEKLATGDSGVESLDEGGAH